MFSLVLKKMFLYFKKIVHSIIYSLIMKRGYMGSWRKRKKRVHSFFSLMGHLGDRNGIRIDYLRMLKDFTH